MGLNDWNWQLAADRQDVPWDCAATSLAWCLRTIGLDYTEFDVTAGLGPSRINSTYGLLDASGAGLVSYLAELGIVSSNNPAATWRQVMDAAGYQPMLMGGRRWCHWVAVRIGSEAAGRPDIDAIALMNPSPGYLGVADVIEMADFERLGPFSAVWLEAWPQS